MGKRDWAVFVHRRSDSSQGLAWRVLPFFCFPQSEAYGGECFIFHTYISEN
jgi:hypothetical protein